MPRHLGIDVDFHDIEAQLKQLLLKYDTSFKHFGIMKLLKVIGISYRQWYNIKLTGRAETGTIKTLSKGGIVFPDDTMNMISDKSKKNKKKVLQ